MVVAAQEGVGVEERWRGAVGKGAAAWVLATRGVVVIAEGAKGAAMVEAMGAGRGPSEPSSS
jgi:hypothetical protein